MSLRFGLLGASRIAPAALIGPARALGIATPVAVASRSGERARQFARAHDIGIALEGYEALLDLGEVDAVYNGLPISQHAELTIAALRRGKHVLCEKPFAMSADEARAMVAEARARGLILMEAFHYRYHPLFQRLLEVIASGEIGAVRHIEAVFNAPVERTADEIRFDPALGGGALWDLGAYCVHWARTVAGGEPIVEAASHVLADTGVDLSTEASLIFPQGVTGTIACDMAAAFTAYVLVTGDKGTARAVNPLVPQYGHSLEIETAAGRRSETLTLQPTYEFQLIAFADAIRTGHEPPTGGGDAIAQLETLERIRDAARAA